MHWFTNYLLVTNLHALVYKYLMGILIVIVVYPCSQTFDYTFWLYSRGGGEGGASGAIMEGLSPLKLSSCDGEPSSKASVIRDTLIEQSLYSQCSKLHM